MLRRPDVILQLSDHVQSAKTRHFELHAGVRAQSVHLQGYPASLRGNSNLTPQHLIAVFIEEREVPPAISDFQHHGAVHKRVRNVKPMNTENFATPAKTR
ncbi:hypothetical protein D3C71_1448510 [compost metagenome]